MNLRQKILRSEMMSSPQKVRVLAVLEHLSQERLNELEATLNLEIKFEEDMLLNLETEFRKSEAMVREHFEAQSS